MHSVVNAGKREKETESNRRKDGATGHLQFRFQPLMLAPHPFLLHLTFSGGDFKLNEYRYAKLIRFKLLATFAACSHAVVRACRVADPIQGQSLARRR